MKKSTYLPYLKTLRRIPSAVILDLAAREMILRSPSSCLCGWALRDMLGVAATNGAHDIHTEEGERIISGIEAADPRGEGMVTLTCKRVFGGSEDEWEAVFAGVVLDALPNIEEAFTRRVMECCK